MLKKIIKILLVVLIASPFVFLAGNALLIYLMEIPLRRTVSEIRESGDPVSVADLEDDPVPAAHNAEEFYLAAQEEVRRCSSSVKEVWVSQSYTGGWLNAAQAEAIEELLEKCPNVVALVRKAAERPHYVPNIDYSSKPAYLASRVAEVGYLESVARLFYLSILLDVHRGKHDHLFEDAIALFRVARHFDNVPGLDHKFEERNGAVKAAVFALSFSQPTDQSRQALEAELALHHLLTALERGLKEERAIHVEHDDTIKNGRWFYRCSRIDNHHEKIQVLSRQLAAIHLEYADFQASEAGQSDSIYAWFPHMAYGSMVRAKTWIRCLRILNALHARDPATLEKVTMDDLGLSPETGIDPYNGKSLLVKRLNHGWLVYSVGANFQDDGGQVDVTEQYVDVGVATWSP